MKDQKENPPEVPYLCVTSYGQTRWVDLDAASNALIGSGGHCRVQISGSDVRSLHCIVAMQDGRLEVRDWNTGCTFVNGVLISEPTELKEGDCLKIGDHEITAVLSEAGAQAATEPKPTEPRPEADVAGDPVREVQSAANVQERPVLETVQFAETQPFEGTEPVRATESVRATDPVKATDPVRAKEPVGVPVVFEVSSQFEVERQPSPEPAAEIVEELPPETVVEVEPEVRVEVEPEVRVEVEPATIVKAEAEPEPVIEPQPEPVIEPQPEPQLQPQTDPQPAAAPAEFVYDINADLEDEDSEVPFGFAAPGFTDETVSIDELQTLRMENEQLRFELSQQGSNSSQNSDLLSREQTVKLVSRLEDMVVELKRSDARALEMEELLRSADQATQDEQEERKQIEKWVSELESRVTQRESEAAGEIQTLKKLLAEARQSQQQSNDCLQNVMESKTDGGNAIPVELAQGLRNQIVTLQNQLNSAQEDAASLREQLGNSGPRAEGDLQKAEQKLAEMQLESSRERAELSRQRVELNRLKSELEDRLSAPREANVADTRIRAMREHLKELHDEEVEAKSNQRGTEGGGLANRIANLLQRVTGE